MTKNELPWEPVYAMLTRAGHRVSVLQHTTATLADDVAQLVASIILDATKTTERSRRRQEPRATPTTP